MTPAEKLEQLFPLVLHYDTETTGLIRQRRDTLRRVCAYIMARGCLSSHMRYRTDMEALEALLLEGLDLKAADLEGLE